MTDERVVGSIDDMARAIEGLAEADIARSIDRLATAIFQLAIVIDHSTSRLAE